MSLARKPEEFKQNITGLSTQQILQLKASELNNEKVIIPLLNATPADTIIAAIRAKAPGEDNTFHTILDKQISPKVLEVLLKKIDTDTMDNLMILPGKKGFSLFQLLLRLGKECSKYSILEAHICAILEKTSGRAINRFAREDRMQMYGYEKAHALIDFLSTLLITNHSQKVIDAFCSRLTKETLDAIFKNGCFGLSHLYVFGFESHQVIRLRIALQAPMLSVKKGFIYLLPYMSDERLSAIIECPADLTVMKNELNVVTMYRENVEVESLVKFQDKINEHLNKLFFEKISENSAVFNEIINRLLSTGKKITLQSNELRCLNSNNMKLYLVQHPDMNIDQFKSLSSTVGVFERLLQKKTTFENELNQAELIFSSDISFHLYQFLKTSIQLPNNLVFIILYYFGTDPKMVERIHLEIDKQVILLSEQKLEQERLKLPTILPINSQKEQEPSLISKFSSLFDIQKKSPAIASAIAEYTKKRAEAYNTYCSCSSTSKRAVAYDECKKTIKILERELHIKCLTNLLAEWGKPSVNHSKKLSQTSPSATLQIIVNQYGYDCRDVKRDGNCFFHAIADQITEHKLNVKLRTASNILKTDHTALRATALGYIANYPDEFKDFIDDHTQDINLFIYKNKLIGTWADHLIITALSRALNVSIAIIRNDGAHPTIIKQPEPIATLTIGYEVGQHYQSLIFNKDLTPKRSLKRHIDSAPLDREEPKIGLAAMYF